MPDIIDDVFADDAELPVDKLQKLVILCNRLAEMQAHASEQEEIAKQAKANARMVAEQMIPTLMEEIGVEKLTLPDGRDVSVSTAYRATANRPDQFKWLEDHGHGSIIKKKVEVTLDNDVPERVVEDLLSKITEEGYDEVKVAKAVPWNTLSAFVKEDIEGGAGEVPLDLFKVFIQDIAKVK